MNRVRMRTNAKVNLFLRVLGGRPDGYHEIETILHGIRLADDIEAVSTDTGRVEIDMRLAPGLRGELPRQHENLVFRAAQRLIDRGGVNAGVSIAVTKRIPIGAGLGGGSGNAAGILVALNEMWKMDLAVDELLRVAGLVGSDVPYCIDGGTALATSRGEELMGLPAPQDLWLVLGLSFDPLMTRDAYEAWRPEEAGTDVSSAPMTLALGAGDVTEIASLLHNDLELAIFQLRPELESKKERMIAAGALGACVSGSGPTIFGVASDESHARFLAAAVAEEFDDAVAVVTQAQCIERLD
jgi:4-diphosphocytidyl-2-C-methyl-D-erythritol kinase